MKYNNKIHKTYDVSRITPELKHIYKLAKQVGFTRAAGFGRRVGGSLKRNALSEYEYINTRKMISEPTLRAQIKVVCKSLNVSDCIITHNFLHLQPNDFLDWQDYWQDYQQTRSIVTLSKKWMGPFTNFFSIALTDGNVVEFKDEVIDVPIYHGIVFPPSDVHRVPKVKKPHTWLVLGIPDHLDVGKILFNNITVPAVTV